jgi:hypothetical protein
MTISTKYFASWQLPFEHSLSQHTQLELYAEQVREKTQGYSIYSQINETPAQFQSTKDSRPFECPIHTLDPSKVVIFYDDPENLRMRDFISERSIRFPIHPANEVAPKIDQLRSASLSSETTLVFPTASTRTVRLWDPAVREGFKLDLHRRISRYDRRLGVGTISHSVEVSKRLTDYLKNTADPHTAIMKEDFGAAFITEDSPSIKGWGFLHREMALYPSLSQQTYSIPMFSLYGIDPASPETKPVLTKILDNCTTNNDRIETVLEHIYFPIIRSWTRVFQNTGIILEPHGQNSRIEFVADDEQYKLTGRIGHLDFDAAVSMKMLDSLDLDPKGFYKGQLIESLDGHEISTIYDKSVGKMLFDQIGNLLHFHYKIDPAVLQQRCQEEFVRCFPNFYEYFPEKTYNYSDQPISENAFDYVCTGEFPKWRPSK